jgi:hypothetical protein
MMSVNVLDAWVTVTPVVGSLVPPIRMTASAAAEVWVNALAIGVVVPTS